MARKKIVKKIDVKDDLDPNNDEFVVKSMSFLDWAVERRKQLGALMLLILLAAIAGIIFNRVMESEKESSSTLLEAGLEVAVAPIIPSEDDIPAANADDDRVWFETTEAKTSKSLELFGKVIEQKPGSTYAAMAALNMAAAKYDTGKYDEAIKQYNTFLSSIDETTKWLQPNAIEGLGQALEASGKIDEARAEYKKLSSNEEGDIALIGKYNEARLIAKTDKDTAVTMLKEVVDKVRDSGKTDKFNFLFVEARERLLDLDPDAVVPDLPTGMDLNNMDPAMLQRLIQARQAAAKGASL